MKLPKHIFSLLLLLLASSLLIACQSKAEEFPTPDPDIVEPLLETTWAGTMEALSAEERTADLELTTNNQGQLVFSLDFLFVGRTTRPTNRTGIWHYDGSTLTLAIVEQDGEPVDQDAMLFAVNQNQLVATIFDKDQFDVNDFVLTQQ